jgi:hypothetical protein
MLNKRRNKMKNIFKYAIILAMLATIVNATSYRQHRVNIKALSTTEFELTDINFENPEIRDLKGKDFIVVSVREPGSDGRVYAVDKDGTIWWHGAISSGAGGGHLKNNKVVGGHETSNNIFKILAKRRFHMSKAHPAANGVNNMDFELQFTQDGQALHLGNTAAMSHGCIHVGRQDISALFKWAQVGMHVVIMRGPYKQSLSKEFNNFKEDIKDYNAETGQ